MALSKDSKDVVLPEEDRWDGAGRVKDFRERLIIGVSSAAAAGVLVVSDKGNCCRVESPDVPVNGGPDCNRDCGKDGVDSLLALLLLLLFLLSSGLTYESGDIVNASPKNCGSGGLDAFDTTGFFASSLSYAYMSTMSSSN